MLDGSEKHGYGDNVPSPEKEFEQMLIKNNKEAFLADLAKYIRDHLWNNKHDRYAKSFTTSISKEKSLRKAEEILEGSKKTELKPKINFNQEEHLKILKNAEEKGYLENFRLNLPWHVKPFLAGEFTSFPYQHDYAILYTGINDKIFAPERRTPDALSDQKSVLKKGYIMGRQEDGEGPIDMQNLEALDRATWLAFPNVAKLFAHSVTHHYDGKGIVLEIKVPTDQLETIVAPQHYRETGKGMKTQTIHLSNLEELKEEFNEEKFDTSLQAFRHYCKIAAETEIKNTKEDLPRAEMVHFAVQHEIKLENVLGVWDIHYSKKPVFESLGGFVKRWKKEYGEESIKRTMERELKELSNLQTDIENLKSDVENIEALREEGKNERLSKSIKRYNEDVKELKKFLEQQFNAEIEFSQTDELNRKKLSEIMKHLAYIKEEIGTFTQQEKKKAVNQNWNPERVKKEKDYEKKANREIIENLSRIPVFSIDHQLDNRVN